MSKIIVIIPTYNEKDNIIPLIEAIIALPIHCNILIVDDNSPDGTAEIVKKCQKRYNTATASQLHLLERSAKLGLGKAYISAFKYVLEKGYEYIFEMDADFSHNPKDIVKLYKACAEGSFDMAIGSRYITGVNVVNWPIKRVLLSYFANFYVRTITRMPIRDATSGFVCYHRKVLETIPLDSIKLIGYAFQIEIKFLTWKYAFSMTEIPIIFTERIHGESKLSTGIFKEAFAGVIKLVIKSWFRKHRTNSPTHDN